MSNARTWVKWIQFGALLVVVGGLAAGFLLGDGARDVLAMVERGFVVAMVAIMGLVVLALGWQALADLSKSPTDGVTGQVALSITAPRRGLWVVVGVLAVGAIATAWWVRTGPSPDANATGMSDLALEPRLMAWLFIAIWAVLMLGFTAMAIRRAPWFVLTDRGFLYAPGGVSPGFVRWEDVTSLRETEVVDGRTRTKPKATRVLAVGLRDPSKYNARYTPMLALLVRLGGKLYAAQTDGPADILIDPTHFGDAYDGVLARMVALHAEAQR